LIFAPSPCFSSAAILPNSSMIPVNNISPFRPGRCRVLPVFLSCGFLSFLPGKRTS
jgi:hypothetical protein